MNMHSPAAVVFVTIVRITYTVKTKQQAKQDILRCCECCRWYDGDTRSKDMWKQKCKNYIVTNQHAEYLRKRIKVVKK